MALYQKRNNLTNNDIDTVFSFNEEFCDHLEYHLCRTFENSGDKEFYGFWCDGISHHPETDQMLERKNVNDTRRIETTGWMGKSGQDAYQVTIKFGKHSLRRYAKGSSLIDCLPSEESMDWIDIDTTHHLISIELK